ncbi:DNA gyrase subunit A [Candidatus Woesearchaeota archaeon]|nr:DNA gyrase subunit A [Candidatus Woesearchaeota archaeon]
MAEKVIPKLVEEEMKQYYLDYSLSVIVGRALPDARDGLKPVHRRILYAMRDMGMLANKPFKKSARVVGEVLGKLHPHGDQAVYDALVRMAQEFSLRYPLINGQGNFGSIDGDRAAAMRYTETRLRKLAEDLLQDLDKQTVSFTPNFDGSLEEPTVLPSKAPNLLVNGSTGIAVGMATNIPPHNMGEVCDAAMRLVDNPELTVQDLMENVKGPDFPTGGIVHQDSNLANAYARGRGRIIVRSRVEVEEGKKAKLIVTEIPYMVNKSMLIEQIADLVRSKKIPGIGDIRDESGREGMRIVLELKQGANPEVVQNQLFSHSRLQETFSIIMLALVDNAPRVLTLKGLLQEFLKHREEVVKKRTMFDLLQAEEKAHILEGLIVALENIDAVVDLIRGSKNQEEARAGLIKQYELTDKQARAILELRIGRLVSLEQESIRTEHKELVVLIAELKDILANRDKILTIIKDELSTIKNNYADERRTQLVEGSFHIDAEELIKPEEVVVTLSNAGYAKRLPIDTYKAQGRGGKGVIGAEAREGDFLEHIFTANTLDNLLFFTDKGKVHWLKVHNIPEAGRYAKGVALANLLELRESRVTAFVSVKDFTKPFNVFMTTRKGTVKKTPLKDFSNPRKGGIIAITLDEGDELISAITTDGGQNMLVSTANGFTARFKEEDVRATGRSSKGVIGINLREGDIVVGAARQAHDQLLTISEQGYGKRTDVEEYRFTKRGSSGVTNLKVTPKTGKVIAAKTVQGDEELILMSHDGQVIRTKVKNISVIGRATQGVRVMRVSDGDRLVSATVLRNGKEEQPDHQVPEDSEPAPDTLPDEPPAEPQTPDADEPAHSERDHPD